MCPSDTDTLHLVRDLPLKVHSLEPHSDESEAAAAFWKQLATHVQPRHDGGRIDIFADTLAGSVSCVEFVASVEHVADLTTMVTKLEDASATAAAGAAPTASSSSSSSSQKAGSSSEPLPSRFYFNLAKLEVWSLLLPTSRTVVALAKESFEPLLQQVSDAHGLQFASRAADASQAPMAQATPTAALQDSQEDELEKRLAALRSVG